jgi:hypothetical protein
MRKEMADSKKFAQAQDAPSGGGNSAGDQGKPGGKDTPSVPPIHTIPTNQAAKKKNRPPRAQK